MRSHTDGSCVPVGSRPQRSGLGAAGMTLLQCWIMPRGSTVLALIAGAIFTGVVSVVPWSTGPGDPGPTEPPAIGSGASIRSRGPGPDGAPGRIPPRAAAGRAGGRSTVSSAGTEIADYLYALLSQADPHKRVRFEEGMDLMARGEYGEARQVLQEFQDSGETSLRAPSHWALALSYYLEGGEDNLCLAAGRFADFVVNYSEPDVLLEAAQIDLAIVSMDLMRTGSTERSRADAAWAAARALKAVLARWPDNDQAPAVRSSLHQVEEYLALLSP